jgi:hypothetical protein
MNNITNLGATQTAPATQGLAGPAASNSGSSLFSALMMQQMSPDLSGAGDAQMPNLGQSLSGNSDLAKLFPGLVAPSKDSKLTMPVNRQTDNPADGSDTNPAIALWLASMAAIQTQPTAQPPSLQLNGITSQLTGAGADQNAALQALEQQFPGLVMALKDKHQVDAKPQAAKTDIEGAAPDVRKTGQESSDIKTSDIKTSDINASDIKVTDVKPVAVKNDFSAELNAVRTAEPAKVDAPQAPVHATADMTDAAAKTSDLTTKSKIDQKDLTPNAAVKESQPAVAQVTPQNQSSDAKPQSQDQPQSQSGDSHTGNQTRKDSGSATQSQQSSGPANGSATASSTAVDPANFATLTQTVAHGATANAPNHQASSAMPQPVTVHEVSAAVGADPAPRIVHAARLMEAAGQAEMRVSLKSDVSGTVDVRAVLENGNISATVAAQHGGTRDWMMANMHELQTSLSHDDLNLKTFEVTDSGLQNNGRGDEPRQQEPQQQRNSNYSNFVSETRSIPTSFDDLDSPETPSRALSLLA